jgi:DedD protein
MKQRLVGTLVLGSLALILIQLLLDGAGVERPPLSATIPPAPVFDTSPLPEPERPRILADNLNLQESGLEPPAATTDASPDTVATTVTEPEETPGVAEQTPAAAPEERATNEIANEVTTNEAAPTTVAPPAVEEAPAQSTSEPALDAAALPEAWTVRLGSFGNRANADALVARLLAADHKAYIRPVMSGDVALHGVFVGPVLTRNEAAALSTELKRAFQINDAIVQRYDIAQ